MNKNQTIPSHIQIVCIVSQSLQYVWFQISTKTTTTKRVLNKFRCGVEKLPEKNCYPYIFGIQTHTQQKNEAKMVAVSDRYW